MCLLALSLSILVSLAYVYVVRPAIDRLRDRRIRRAFRAADVRFDQLIEDLRRIRDEA